jgi:hypothetical protein
MKKKLKGKWKKGVKLRIGNYRLNHKVFSIT